MKRKKNKYDFLEINRQMNGNWKGKGWFEYKDITKGEEIKLSRKLQKGNKRK